MTGQNWPDFFCQETFFEVLGKSVAKGHGPPPQSKCCFSPTAMNFRLYREHVNCYNGTSRLICGVKNFWRNDVWISYFKH